MLLLAPPFYLLVYWPALQQNGKKEACQWEKERQSFVRALAQMKTRIQQIKCLGQPMASHPTPHHSYPICHHLSYLSSNLVSSACSHLANHISTPRYSYPLCHPLSPLLDSHHNHPFSPACNHLFRPAHGHLFSLVTAILSASLPSNEPLSQPSSQPSSQP